MRLASLFALAILLPLIVQADDLININTADASLLDTLPGIGAVKATAIVDYRTANGLFAEISDIQNVSGIGAATYANISSLITVGTASTPAPDPVATSTPASTPTETTTSSASSAPPEYIPIPTLRLITTGDRTVSAGADIPFSVVVYDSKGNRRDDALVKWSFGDGMQRTGANVYHRYYEPGEYMVVLRVTTSDGGEAVDERIITAKSANVIIASVTNKGIELTNSGNRILDLSLWRLSMGGKEFKIPDNTQILAGRTILFPSQIIQLPVSVTATLLYPSGEAAAIYPNAQIATVPQIITQPSLIDVSYQIVQKVEPIISVGVDYVNNEEAVSAPAAETNLAAVGAAVPDSANSSNSPFGSPWVLGLVGIMVLSGGAFIFLK